jgi:hypothetical protein
VPAASADRGEQGAGASPAIARATEVRDVAADVVVLTAEHREYLAALAHDLAAQGAAL